MPTTKFKLCFETKKQSVEIDKFQKSLPPTFQVSEENGSIFLNVQTPMEEDKDATYLVERELDRHFFLTCVKISAEMVRKTVGSSLTFRFRIHGNLPYDITPQNWSPELSIQLRLWAMAVDLHNEFRMQILFYFQIIEIAYPSKSSYPDYTDSTQPPHPLTECKFIRHLVAHAGQVKALQLKLYCRYLGVPEIMSNITDRKYYEILSKKVKLLEDQAKLVIEKFL